MYSISVHLYDPKTIELYYIGIFIKATINYRLKLYDKSKPGMKIVCRAAPIARLCTTSIAGASHRYESGRSECIDTPAIRVVNVCLMLVNKIFGQVSAESYDFFLNFISLYSIDFAADRVRIIIIIAIIAGIVESDTNVRDVRIRSCSQFYFIYLFNFHVVDEALLISSECSVQITFSSSFLGLFIYILDVLIRFYLIKQVYGVAAAAAAATVCKCSTYVRAHVSDSIGMERPCALNLCVSISWVSKKPFERTKSRERFTH